MSKEYSLKLAILWKKKTMICVLMGNRELTNFVFCVNMTFKNQ